MCGRKKATHGNHRLLTSALARRTTRMRRITQFIRCSPSICRITSRLRRKRFLAELRIRDYCEYPFRCAHSAFVKSYAQSCRSTNCQCAGRTEHRSWRSNRLRFSALSSAWDHARSRAAYRGANRQRGLLRLWEMAGRRCRYCDCASQLGIIGRTCYLSALLLWKQFKPGWPAHFCATILYRQFPSWLLLPIYGSLDV